MVIPCLWLIGRTRTATFTDVIFYFHLPLHGFIKILHRIQIIVLQIRFLQSRIILMSITWLCPLMKVYLEPDFNWSSWEPDNSLFVKDIKRVISFFFKYIFIVLSCNFKEYFQSINNAIKCNVLFQTRGIKCIYKKRSKNISWKTQKSLIWIQIHYALFQWILFM